MSKRCELDADDIANLGDTDYTSVPYTENCVVEAGSTFRLITHPPRETMPAPELSHQEAAPVHVEAPVAHEAPAAEPAAPMEALHPAEPALHPEVQIPAVPDSVPDLSQLQGLAGGNPILMVVMAVILVGGGTAGWKHWSKLSEQKHEREMAKLEMEKSERGLNGQSPGPCLQTHAKLVAEIQAVSAKVDAMGAKVEGIEKKSSSFSASGFDPEEHEERMKVVEKSIKRLKAMISEQKP